MLGAGLMVVALCEAFPLSVLPVCTVPPGPITVSENNTADVQLVLITSGSEVTLTVTVNPESLFYLKGNALMVKKGLDYEVSLGQSNLIKKLETRNPNKSQYPLISAMLMCPACLQM